MRIITIGKDNKIVSEKTVNDDYLDLFTLGDDEMISNVGEVGQILQDGNFINPSPVVVEVSQPTLEDKINYLYYKSMEVI